MLQISIAGYLVGAMFLNQAYSELIYTLLALSVSLEVVAETETAEEGIPMAAPAEPE